MKPRYKICVLSGDGIGPEIAEATYGVLHRVEQVFGVSFDFEEALIGGCAIDATGTALPEETLALARESDAVLLGAVGGPKWDTTSPEAPRPEDGLLGIRKELGLYMNLRPVQTYSAIASSSPVKADRLENVDILIVRELTGGLYFGEHATQAGVAGAGVGGAKGTRAYDVMEYSEHEIERIMRRAFEMAATRRGRVTSVDKANVLDTGRLWRRVAHEVATEFPEVEHNDMLVDNCAMQLVAFPAQFDVIVTENTFGDILSDEASVLAGSLGLLASASIGDGVSLYEPCHGSAPDISGKNWANPIGQIQSAAMMLRYGFGMDAAATAVDNAVQKALDDGWRTRDIAQDATPASQIVGTHEMSEKIIERIREDV